MKIEKRGKYAGVKVHLEPDEVEPFMKLFHDFTAIGKPLPTTVTYFSLALKLGKKIVTLMKEEPSLLLERTPEEITLELENELESATLKLAAIKAGKGWKEIHVV